MQGGVVMDEEKDNINKGDEEESNINKKGKIIQLENTIEEVVELNKSKRQDEKKTKEDSLQIHINDEIVQEQEIDTVEKKYKDRNKKRNIIICFIATIILIITIIISTTVSKYDSVVYPGAYIYGEDISNLNKDQLNKKLNNIITKIDKKEIQIKAQDKTYDLFISDIVADYKQNILSNEILNKYENKNIFQKFSAILTKKKQLYTFDMYVKDNILNKKLTEIGNETNKRCKEPKVVIDEDSVKIKDGKKGTKLDYKSLEKDIKNVLKEKELYTKSIIISGKYIDDNPKIDKKELSKVNHKISTYTTTYSPGGGRGINVAIAAKKIDDILLMPGDDFSYEDAVGPIAQSNGYTYAPVISNGELVQGIGGGVCQVSSTLYNTQLKSGILPTERRNHSKAVSYVPRGLDATLASGSIDYKFKNTHKYPVVINTYTGGGKLTIEFWSNKNALEGIEYKPVGYANGNVANTYLYGYDKEGKKVYEKHIDTSVYR